MTKEQTARPTVEDGEPTEATPYLVFSWEHNAFWSPDRCGYTRFIERAGRYSQADAEAICRNADYRTEIERKRADQHTPPSEICFPAPEAMVAASPPVDHGRVEIEADAARFRALMRCPRIKMQGSAGVDPKTGERTDNRPGGVHFGAEFWPVGPHHESGQCEPTWGRHCLRALADDILAVEALTNKDAA
jgi:hypothetical protein